MKKKKPKKVSGNQKKLVALKRQILVLENLRKRRLQKNSENSGELKILAMGIAHEFNNILGAVDGHAEWALESKNPADWKSSLEIIRLACVRSSEITAALRGWGQPREEQKELFSIASVLAEIKTMLEPGLRQSGIELEIESVEASVYGNPTEILEVILNLVKNSHDALTVLSSNKKISIVASIAKRRLQIDVVDSGSGIPEIYREKIFEPFFTLKGVLKNVIENSPTGADGAKKGSGLGLFLSRSIIEEHGGKLMLQPSKIGAHFKINLPLTES